MRRSPRHVRLLGRITGLLFLGLALHIHHRFRGPAIDYGALSLASAASWVGVPGPGEPVLIAAGVIAARHHLDITSVILVAWGGATVGGIAGWLIGLKAGRVLLTAPGPLLRLRLAAVARGDEVFRRLPVIAILLAPSWVAGIHRVRSAIYLPTNAVGAAAWAAGIGLGAYYVGPPIIDFVQDLGVFTAIGIVVLVGVAVGLGIAQRRRHRRRKAMAQDR
jgi:membrane protein DedA with SNARE-associated domain